MGKFKQQVRLFFGKTLGETGQTTPRKPLTLPWRFARTAWPTKRLWAGLILVVLGLLACQAASAPLTASAQGRPHCGVVTTNEIWTVTDSPHRITCDVKVRGSQLLIEPGAQVAMSEGTNLIIEAGAELSAVGNMNAGIRFLSDSRDETPGFWGQLRIETSAKPSAMAWVTLFSGGKNNVPMVEVHAPTTMDYMRFQLSKDAPLAFSPDALGPSLEAIGSLTQMAGCQRMQFISAGAPFITILAGAEVDVADNQRWFNFCVPYRVNGSLLVAGPETATLTLGEGVILRFDGDTGIVVGQDAGHMGSLETNGSSAAPVKLTAESGKPGGWNGVTLTRFSANNSLFNTVIEFGGRGGKPMMSVDAVESNAAAGTRFRGSAGYPLVIRAAAVGNFVTGLTTESDPIFADNAKQRVLVLADQDAVDVPRSIEWVGLGVPYEIQGDLLVAGTPFAARFSLTNGAELIFDGTESLIVGDEKLGQGSLVTRGTNSRPVVLTGELKQPGSWGGIKLTKATVEANLDGLVLEYGGAGGAALLEWGEAKGGTVVRSTFRHGLAYPVALPLANMEVFAGEAQQDPSQRNKFESNGTDRILVRTGTPYNARLATWADPGAPIEFDGTVVIARAGNGVVNLVPGLRLLFRPGTQLKVGTDANARATLSVKADGPDPVDMGPLDPAKGWGGVRAIAGSGIQASGSIAMIGLLVHGIAPGEAGIFVDGGVGRLEGVEVKAGPASTGILAGNGARLELTSSRVTGNEIGVKSREKASLMIDKAIIQGNSAWGVQNEDPTICPKVTHVYWGDANGPNDPSKVKDGCLNGTNDSPKADKVSDHVDWWPWALDPESWEEPPFTRHPHPIRVYLPIGYRGVGVSTD